MRFNWKLGCAASASELSAHCPIILEYVNLMLIKAAGARKMLRLPIKLKNYGSTVGMCELILSSTCIPRIRISELPSKQIILRLKPEKFFTQRK